jgi:hypothetical protein
MCYLQRVRARAISDARSAGLAIIIAVALTVGGCGSHTGATTASSGQPAESPQQAIDRLMQVVDESSIASAMITSPPSTVGAPEGSLWLEVKLNARPVGGDAIGAWNAYVLEYLYNSTSYTAGRPLCFGITIAYVENGSDNEQTSVYRSRRVANPVTARSAAVSQIRANAEALDLTDLSVDFVATEDVVPIVTATTPDAKAFAATSQNPMVMLNGSAYHAAYVEIVDSDGAAVESGGFVTDAGSGLRWIRPDLDANFS